MRLTDSLKHDEGKNNNLHYIPFSVIPRMTLPSVTIIQLLAELQSDSIYRFINVLKVLVDEYGYQKILNGCANVFASGAKKYKYKSYLKLPIERIVAAIYRHGIICLDNIDAVDDESGELHLYHFACGLMMAIEVLEKDKNEGN
jgi:hypothetical protein